MRQHASTLRRSAARAGFTLVELLVVVAVIGLLLAIVLVAGNAVLSTARQSDTTRLLATIAQGLDQFEKDHGYYPPLLNENYDNGDWGSAGNPGPTRLVVANEWGAGQRQFDPYFAGPIMPGDETQAETGDPRSFNIYSLPIYLLGIGDLNGDSERQGVYDDPGTPQIEHNLDDGVDGPGLRSPGGDRSWGGSRDRTSYPDGGPHRPPTEGRVFGPYVDVGSGRNLELMPEQSTVPGQENYFGLYRFVDRWGQPIRYYRDWTLRDQDNNRSMANVPFELREVNEAREMLGGGYEPQFDASMQRIIPELAGAPYVLLSVGQDGKAGHRTINDLQGLFGAGGDGKAAADLLEELSDNVRHIP